MVVQIPLNTYIHMYIYTSTYLYAYVKMYIHTYVHMLVRETTHQAVSHGLLWTWLKGGENNMLWCL